MGYSRRNPPTQIAHDQASNDPLCRPAPLDDSERRRSYSARIPVAAGLCRDRYFGEGDGTAFVKQKPRDGPLCPDGVRVPAIQDNRQDGWAWLEFGSGAGWL